VLPPARRPEPALPSEPSAANAVVNEDGDVVAVEGGDITEDDL
jgi:hypothetical protein